MVGGCGLAYAISTYYNRLDSTQQSRSPNKARGHVLVPRGCYVRGATPPPGARRRPGVALGVHLVRAATKPNAEPSTGPPDDPRRARGCRASELQLVLQQARVGGPGGKVLPVARGVLLGRLTHA